MHGKYFTYNGYSSEDFGLMLGGFNVNEDIPLGLSRNILKGEMNRYRKIPNFMGTSYVDVLQFTISLIKDPCENANQEDMVFTEDEVDEITTWLTSPNYPILFHMYDYEPDVYAKYDYFAVVSDIQPQVLSGDVIGFTVSFVTNSPYAWTEKRTFNITDNTEDEEHTEVITINTSERLSPIYPVITITPYISAPSNYIDVTLTNERDGGEMTLHLLKDITTIDCQHTMIKGTAGLLSFEDLGIADVDNIYWFRLWHGDNPIKVTGYADIKIEYREPRKVGAY